MSNLNLSNRTKRLVRPWVKKMYNFLRVFLLIFIFTILLNFSISIDKIHHSIKYTTIKRVYAVSEIEDKVFDTSNYNNDDDSEYFLLDKIGYINAISLRIRERPDINSNTIDYLYWGNEIKYSIYNDDWVVIQRNDDKYLYLSKQYVVDKMPEYKSKSAEGDKRKTFMDYRTITDKGSPQYRLQKNCAYTDTSTGIRMVDGRYCIALGSYYTHKVGRYVDLVLENGTVLKCILGDRKADKDTLNDHSIHTDGSISEFIVDENYVPILARQMGDMSYAVDGWLSKVVEVRIYEDKLEF